MAENERAASSPAKGAGREGIRIAIAGFIVKALSGVVPEIMLPEIEIMVFAILAIAAAAAGKYARDNDIPWLGSIL